MAGETVVRSGASTTVGVPGFNGPVLNAVVWTHEVDTGELEEDDVLVMGYIPAGATLLAIAVTIDDLDEDASPALVSKITVGSTDVASALTLGQSAGSTWVAFTPQTVTTPTAVKWQVTTVPATAAGGTLTFVPIYAM